MTNLLEPWVLLRLVAGMLSCAFFVRSALTAQKVLRHFDARRRTEGQLALERQLELAATFSRVAAFTQVSALVLSVLAADRLSRGVRGAMCAYGVFSASPWGFRSLLTTGGIAIAAAIVSQVYAFDARVRSLDLARPLSVITCAMAPLSVIDLAATGKFLLDLDLGVVASCCSVQLDSAADASEAHPFGPRVLVTLLAVVATTVAIVAAIVAAHRPTRARILTAGLLSALATPLAVGASMLEVAPHAFEVPTHVCPFCLLKPDVFGLGYLLFGAIFLGMAWAGGVATSALLARSGATREALGPFASRRLRLGAFAWSCALLVGALPVVRFALVTHGAALFPGP